MILSRRERYIVIGTVAVVGLLALDRLFLTPLIERRQVIDAEMRKATAEMTRANGLFTNSPRVNRKWNEMTEPLEGEGIAVVDELRDGFVESCYFYHAGSEANQLPHTAEDNSGTGP